MLNNPTWDNVIHIIEPETKNECWADGRLFGELRKGEKKQKKKKKNQKRGKLVFTYWTRRWMVATIEHHVWFWNDHSQQTIRLTIEPDRHCIDRFFRSASNLPWRSLHLTFTLCGLKVVSNKRYHNGHNRQLMNKRHRRKRRGENNTTLGEFRNRIMPTTLSALSTLIDTS